MPTWLRWEVWALVLVAVVFVLWLKDRRFSLRERSDWSGATARQRQRETSDKWLR